MTLRVRAGAKMKLPDDAPIIAAMCVKPIDGQNYHTVGEKYLTGLIRRRLSLSFRHRAGAGPGAAGSGRRRLFHRQSSNVAVSLRRRAGPGGVAQDRATPSHCR
jgi:hypothetical protein